LALKASSYSAGRAGLAERRLRIRTKRWGGSWGLLKPRKFRFSFSYLRLSLLLFQRHRCDKNRILKPLDEICQRGLAIMTAAHFLEVMFLIPQRSRLRRFLLEFRSKFVWFGSTCLFRNFAAQVLSPASIQSLALFLIPYEFE